ncbi:MAG: ABC transporter permease [Anaerolineae bacterium]|nr:ABC transporter permease [Anaerolineae bacterium]
MNLLQNIHLALHALSANKLRASLTMLGIIIGVGAVVALLSIGQGAQAAILGQIEGIGSNLIFVMPGAVSMSAALGEGSTASEVLTLEDAMTIARQGNCPDCSAVAPQYDHGAEIVYHNASMYTTVTGTTPEYQYVRNFDMHLGQFFSDQDLGVAARVAVIGADVADELFGPEDPLGKIVRINRVPFRVIGVLSREGSGALLSRDRAVVVPLSAAGRLFGRDSISGEGSQIVTRINVSATDASRIESAIAQITELLRQRRGASADHEDFSVTSLKDLADVTTSVTRVLTVFLAAIAAISLVVGGIGIMNTMLVSVMERTREIGLRKAVGARRSDILVQFLIEAVVLSLAGGAVGILAGMGISGLVNLSGAFVARLSLQSIALATGFSIAVGVFFGIYPARRAARLNPIEALRYE